MNTALVIIDVQQLLCTGNYKAYESERVIERINEVAARAQAAGAPIIVIQHETAGGGMDHGSANWALAPALQTRPTDLFIRKTTVDSFQGTDLDGLLRGIGITHLVICGFQSDFCVDTTTRRALALGYAVTLVSDGHSTSDNPVLSAAQISAHHNQTLSNIISFGPRVRLVPAHEVRIDP